MLRAAAQRLQRAGLGDLGDAEVGLELGEQLPRAGAADRVADAQAGEAPGLGEAAEDEQPRVALEQPQRGVGRLGVGELDERLVEQHRDAFGQPVEQPLELGGGEQLAGRVVRGSRARSPARRGRAAACEQRVDAAGDRHGLAVGAPRHERVEGIGGPAA